MTDAPFAPTNPKLLDFYALWRGKCGGGRLPARTDFTLEDLRPYIGRIAILDVIDGGSDFRFRLYGTQIAGNLNPLHHCVELVRHAAFGWHGWSDLARVGALVGFGVAMWRLAIFAMTRKLID